MKNVILIAPPAAGKGTQSELLVTNYGYVHISMGDLLREVIASGSDLGLKIKSILDSGTLVDDDLTIELIKKKLNTLNGKHFIVDGFPRTFYQAQEFAKVLKKLNIDDYVVILLNLSKEDAIKRITGRLICKCGRSYNIYDEKLQPKVAGICDKCGSKLVKRDDDNAESFKIRYEIFETNIEPIKDFYEKSNKLSIIDVNRSIEEIAEEIARVIKND